VSWGHYRAAEGQATAKSDSEGCLEVQQRRQLVCGSRAEHPDGGIRVLPQRRREQARTGSRHGRSWQGFG
jgi:hypothetical protein